MNRVRFSLMHLAGLIVVLAGALSLAGQAKPANLFKEVQDRKGKIVWTNAPASLIPGDVCTILGCVTGGDKYIAAPKATEAGRTVGRALILSHDAKKADLLIMRRDSPTDVYFFSIGPDGAVQKVAYWTNGKPWMPMGTSISKPIADKDKQVWLERIEKIGTSNSAPAAPAPQG